MLRKTTARQAAIAVIVAVTYVVAGRLGLALAFVNASATAVWPPTGIALAAVVLCGNRIWPAIFVGAFFTNDTTAGTALTSLLIAAGNTAEALIGAWLFTRFVTNGRGFTLGRDMVALVVVALVSGLVSATVGVTTLAVFGFAAWPDYSGIWLTWWLGDATAAIVVAPAILLWQSPPHVRWPGERLFELLLMAALLVAIGWFVFVESRYPLGFLCFPMCVWVAFRFGAREAAVATCALSMIAVWGTVHGFGPFARESPNDALLLLQSFMAVVSIVSITVSIAVSQRREADGQLRQINLDVELRLADALSQQKATEEIIRRSERRLQTIIDAEPACVKLVSRDGVLLDLNRAGLEIIAARDRSEVIGRQVIDIVHPSDRERYQQMHDAACNGTPGRLEFRVVSFTGDERWVDAHAVPFDAMIGDQTQTAVLSVTSDVTERKRLEEQLRHSQKMEAVGRLAGGVAHDFNNLLTVIQGFSALVLMRVRDRPDVATDVEEIEKAAERAAQLTRQLLAFSRRQVLLPRVLDLNQVVTGVEKMLRRVISEAIHLEIVTAPSVDRTKADQGQIEQLLMNLVVNACDAMPQGGTLTIATADVVMSNEFVRRHSGAHPGRYVSLRVQDTGVGMAPDVLARAFEPFFSTKEPGKGTGLGLSTVYGLVKQTGGYTTIESTPGAGTVVTVYLPAVDEPAEVASAPAQHVPAVRGAETILLVEDEPGVRELMRKILEEHGYTVLQAQDAKQALAIEEGHGSTIHLLLSDIIMPGLNGPGLAQRIVKRRPGVAVLFVSGHAGRQAIDLGVSSQHVSFLQKPFTPESLLTSVRERLEGVARQTSRVSPPS